MVDDAIRKYQRAIQAAPDDFAAHQLLEGELRRLYPDLNIEEQLLNFVVQFNAGMFYIVETDLAYILFNVPHCRDAQGKARQTNVTIMWNKTLLDGGKEHTQDEWLRQLSGTDWELPDSQIFYSTLNTLYLFRKGMQSKLIAGLQALFKVCRKESVATSSLAVYQSTGKDAIMHRNGSKNRYSIQTNDLRNPGKNRRQTEEIVQAVLGLVAWEDAQIVLSWFSNSRTNSLSLGTESLARMDRLRIIRIGSPDKGPGFTIGQGEPESSRNRAFGIRFLR